MNQPYEIPFGTSEPLDFELRNMAPDEPVEPFNGTGFDISHRIAKIVGGVMEAMESPLTVEWLEQSDGTVRVTGAESLDVGNYAVTFVVTDSGGKVAFFPNTGHPRLPKKPAAYHWTVIPVPDESIVEPS